MDTHKYVHVAVALDAVGGRIDARFFSADKSGYDQLLDWAARGRQMPWARTMAASCTRMLAG